jgi:hypothetical protein
MTTPSLPPETTTTETPVETTTTEPPVILNPSFKLVLKKDSQSGAQVAISVSVKVPSLPTYSVSTDVNYFTVNESVIFTVNTEFVPNGTELFWSIVLFNVLPSDFTIEDMEGTFSILDGVAEIPLTLNDPISVPNSAYEPFEAYIFMEVYSDEAKQIMVGKTKKILVYYHKEES